MFYFCISTDQINQVPTYLQHKLPVYNRIHRFFTLSIVSNKYLRIYYSFYSFNFFFLLIGWKKTEYHELDKSRTFNILWYDYQETFKNFISSYYDDNICNILCTLSCFGSSEKLTESLVYEQIIIVAKKQRKKQSGAKYEADIVWSNISIE